MYISQTILGQLPQEICPLTKKFSSKIVAPTQATSPQRVLLKEYYRFQKLFFKAANQE